MNNDTTDVELDGHVYRIGQLDAFTQLHVARRLAPFLSSLAAAAAQVDKGLSKDEWLRAAFGPVSEVISQMADDQVNYILNACLSVVKRQELVGNAEPRWAPIQKSSRLMFQDINAPTLLKLAVAVVRERLGPFFGEALAAFGSASEFGTETRDQE